MDIRESFHVAFDNLRARKGRSALTILGIVIGNAIADSLFPHA